MRLLSRLGLGMAAFALVAGAAGPARAAVLWTLTISPSTVTAGVQTTFSLRASLTLLGEIRCVEVGVPGNFLVTGAAVTGSNAGDSWVSQVVGNDVFVRTTSGGDRLQDPGHYVDFTITATAWTAGSLAWASHTHDREDCTGPESLLSVPPVVLVLASSATPTPAPTVTPTVAPTPRPTATPSILPTLPPITILPTPSPSATLGTPGTSPRASAVTSPSAAATPDPESPADASPSEQAGQASSTPVPSADSGEATGAAPPGSGAGGDGGAADGRLIAEPPASGDGGAPGSMPISLGALGLLGSIDIWIVPGFLLGVPGMLVIAFVMLQAIGALAWIPAIRRLRGEEPEAAVA